MEVIKNKNNLTIILHNNILYCFSYEKKIAQYNILSKEMQIFNVDSNSKTNIKHLHEFKDLTNNLK